MGRGARRGGGGEGKHLFLFQKQTSSFVSDSLWYISVLSCVLYFVISISKNCNLFLFIFIHFYREFYIREQTV